MMLIHRPCDNLNSIQPRPEGGGGRGWKFKMEFISRNEYLGGGVEGRNKISRRDNKRGETVALKIGLKTIKR